MLNSYIMMLNNDIYRIIDANINRASEALRVLEDWARYAINHRIISEKLKNIRHNINNLIVLHPNLILNRESTHDVGRSIENNSIRNSVKDILRANSKRLEEALRVICEYGRLLNIDTRKFENDRYEIYTLEKELIKNEKIIRLQKASLYLVATKDPPSGSLNNVDFLTILEKAIEGGVDIIQLREKNENERNILQLAKEIKQIISGTEVLFIVNDRLDIALACEADGVHLGQGDMPLHEARKIAPDGFIIGLSTHSIEQGARACFGELLADYLGVGPVFQTPTKPDYKAVGLEYVKWAKENIKNIPWFAIGGIDEKNIDKVIEAGAKKVAVVRALLNASNPLQTAKILKTKLFEGIKENVQI